MPDRRDDASPVVRLGVSACPNDFLIGTLGPCVEWVQVSPEVVSGLMAGLDLDGFVLKTARMPRADLARDEEKACSPISDPLLPVEEQGLLCDPAIREHFIERVLAHRRLRRLVASRPGVGDLVSFHTAHKLQLLAHSPDAYRQMGRMVACARVDTFAPQVLEYGRAFAAALATVATRGRRVNVLQQRRGICGARLPPRRDVKSR